MVGKIWSIGRDAHNWVRCDATTPKALWKVMGSWSRLGHVFGPCGTCFGGLGSARWAWGCRRMARHTLDARDSHNEVLSELFCVCLGHFALLSCHEAHFSIMRWILQVFYSDIFTFYQLEVLILQNLKNHIKQPQTWEFTSDIGKIHKYMNVYNHP